MAYIEILRFRLDNISKPSVLWGKFASEIYQPEPHPPEKKKINGGKEIREQGA